MESSAVKAVRASLSAVYANSWAMLAVARGTVQSTNTIETGASTVASRNASRWACVLKVSRFIFSAYRSMSVGNTGIPQLVMRLLQKSKQACYCAMKISCRRT